MSVGMATSAVSKIWEFVGPTILRQGGYILFCKIYAKDLKLQVKKLKDASTRIRHSVAEAESVGDTIEDDVWTWLNKSDQLIESGSMILRENNIVACCFHLVPDPKACYVLGRNAKKSLPNLKAHSSEGKFDKVSYHPVAEAMEVKVRSATSSSTVRYVDLKSRALALNNIMAALDDDNTKVIGVYGMGGVGKTTLLKEVERRARESGKFDDVVSAFVSQNPDTKGIRNKIVNRLGRLGLKEDDATKKHILILLDDLWKKLNLKDLEIPESVKVKLVMTSRKMDLLTNEMNCHRTFSLGILDAEEGWHFFSELVSGTIEDLKRNPAVVELLKKCAGLPVSVEALATVWKKKDLSSSDLLNLDELKYVRESLDGTVSLELSYNSLGDSDEEKQAKLLFRVIGLLGTPKVPIRTLLKYGVGLGLFGNSTNGNIMERARREVTRSLRTLQDSSLLLESDDSDHVKIHDVVRDVAARIASRDDHALIFSPDDGIKGWSRAKMKESTAVSLPYSAIPDIHDDAWNFRDLNIFIMEAGSEQGDPVELPNSYFKGMVKLKVIHLKNARLMSLPSSIQSGPRHLTTLCLHYCYLENVASIGKLKSLQVLSFVGSKITHLPNEIGGLTKLRMLDLSKCSELKMIEPGILGRLAQLEELYLKESFDRWEVDGNSSLAELNNLLQLSTLEVHVPDTNTIPPNLPLGNLVHYKVLVGVAWDQSGEFKEMRTLKFKLKSNNILTKEWLQSSLHKTQDLHLDGLDETRGSFHEECREGFKELKHLHLQNSSSILYIIWSSEWLACSAFTILESLNLEKMHCLEKICHGLMSPTSFSKLKVVRVQECHKLKNLFNLSLVKSLVELEEIDISDCEMVQEIVIAERMDDEDHTVAMSDCSNNLSGCPNKVSEVFKMHTKTTTEGIVGANYDIILGNLRFLRLRNLTKITTFFTKEASSESVEIVEPVFFNNQQVSSNSCKPLNLFSPSKLKETQPRTRLGLASLRRVELLNCKKIVHFINSWMLLKLVALESLTIAGCDLLEDIFDLGGIDVKSENVEILPKLYELKLRNLPKLVHVWKKSSKQIKGCKKLRTLEICRCQNLPYFSSSSMCEGMENLTEINILQCDNMERVFLEEDGLASNASSAVTQLTSLKILAISNCPTLKAFLSGNSRATSSSVASCLNIDYSTTFKCSNKGMAYLCCGKQDLPDTSNSFFSQKVFLPSLETLVLSEAGEFEKLWCGKVPDKSYCNLELVHVKSCNSLSTVFPVSLVESLQNLKQLWLSQCKKLEVIIDIDDEWKTKNKHKALMLPQLEEVGLIDLNNLEHIMVRASDDEVVVGFPSLKRLAVVKCNKLIHLIPTATMTTLLKLYTLDIRGCKMLRDLVNGEVGERNKRNIITFSHLTTLNLAYLDQLICFSSERYIFDFTCLKKLEIVQCDNLKTLDMPRSQDEDRSNTTRQALFNDKVRFPNLEELDILSTGVEELWCNEPPPSSFCKLKVLRIFYCPLLKNLFRSFMIKRLQNLEHMEIGRCDALEDMFKLNSTQQNHMHGSKVLEEPTVDVEKDIEDKVHATDISIILPKLSSLVLGTSVKLRNLWSGRYTLELPALKKLAFTLTDGPTLEAILQKVKLPSLEELLVRGVKEIKELWHTEPLAESFCKLKNLEIYHCEELVKIIPLFMLKRLQNLEKLVVEGCNHLEIVSELGGLNDVQECESKLTSILVTNCECLRYLFSLSGRNHEYRDKIVLPQLTNLRLEDLPNFSHLFHGQGQYTLELSSLKEFFLLESGDKEAITLKVVIPERVEIHDSEVLFFESTTTIVRDIVNALEGHQNNNIIGLDGMMYNELLEELKRQVKDMFDEVVFTEGNYYIVPESLEIALGINYSDLGEKERAQRLRTSLLSNREKRLLLLVVPSQYGLDFEPIPHPPELDSKFFRQILVSHSRPELVKMGAQQFININRVGNRFKVFTWKTKVVFEFPSQQNTEDDDDNSSIFSVGSNTAVMNEIMKFLRSHNKNSQIIGLLGQKENLSVIPVLEYLVKNEANLFDDMVCVDGANGWANEIQEKLGRSLGINYSKSVHERAQHLRQGLLNNLDKRLLLMVILNDLVDQEVNLEAVGIPCTLDPKLFKTILVSKKREVLHKMGAQQVIDITSLFNLWFCIRVLDGYVAKSELQKLADECGCIYLAKLLAKKLKAQGLHAWANAFQRLKESPFEYEARKKVIDSLPN